MGTEQRNSRARPFGVWPEERLREELDVGGRPIERLVGALASDFGLRSLSERGLLHIERALAAQEIAVVPSPLPVDPKARVSLHDDPEVELPCARRASAAEPEGADLDDRRVPTEPWKLTAPESYVLRYGDHGYGYEAFKLTVKELVARGALEIVSVKRRLPGWPFKMHVLREGRRRHSVTEPALLPALELYGEVGKKGFASAETGERLVGVTVERFARAAAKRFKPAFAPYHDGVVVRLLEEKGLATTASKPGLFFTSTKFTRTASGRAADDELHAWLSGGRQQLRELIATNHADARVYAATAGPALLLMSDLAGRLASLAATASDVTAPGGSALDLATLDQLDLAVFRSFDAITTGFAGGGAGGGGGDGGGGGC